MSRTELDPPATDGDGAGRGAPGADEAPVARSRRPWWAPLTRPVVAVPLLIMVLAASAPLAYRSTRIAGLPLIEHPFDLEATGTIEFAEEDNAAPLFAAATAALVRFESLHPGVEAVESIDRATKSGWAGADDQHRSWVEANRGALQSFREGAARPVCVFRQPGELQWDSPEDEVRDLEQFALLATLEGSRHATEGNVAEAWSWYLAVIRASRQFGPRGTRTERLIGMLMLATVAPHAARWAGASAVDEGMLRRADADLRTALDRTAPTSGWLRAEYQHAQSAIRQPDFVRELCGPGASSSGSWIGAFVPDKFDVEIFLANEPEVCDRMLRHKYANWLAYVDRPRSERPPMTHGLFEPFPGDLPRVLRPSELQPHLERSPLARFLFPLVDGAIRRDQALAFVLRTVFAAQLAFRETGRVPERVEDLVPKYLTEIPRDPWDAKGAPLKLRPGADGHLVVWSVGFNGTDEGGIAGADVTKGDFVLDTAPVAAVPLPAETEAGRNPTDADEGEPER